MKRDQRDSDQPPEQARLPARVVGEDQRDVRDDRCDEDIGRPAAQPRRDVGAERRCHDCNAGGQDELKRQQRQRDHAERGSHLEHERRPGRSDSTSTAISGTATSE